MRVRNSVVAVVWRDWNYFIHNIPRYSIFRRITLGHFAPRDPAAARFPTTFDIGSKMMVEIIPTSQRTGHTRPRGLRDNENTTTKI